jgi:hypothetical protein
VTNLFNWALGKSAPKTIPIKIKVDYLMAIDYTALKNYILTGANSATLKPLYDNGDDTGVATALNLVRVGNKVNTGSIPVNQFVKIFVGAEYVTLSQAARDYLQLLTAGGSINMQDTAVITNLSTLFGAGTTTRANFIAAQQRDGSWGESLFGVGNYITDYDIGVARQS